MNTVLTKRREKNRKRKENDMKKIKRLAALALATALTLLPALVSCGKKDEHPNFVCIEVQNYGEIEIELYPEIAPKTVANFKKLVAEGFYTGSSFHRIIDDFMIQGGQSASGKEADSIYGEFESNGHDNDLKHKRGVISMARANDPNSASSEFFIVQTEHAYWLDGDYAAFGEVISGMDVVDRIAGVVTNYYDAPINDVIITKISFINKK